MSNSRVSLDGVWEFFHVDEGGLRPVRVRQINVPAPWQAQFDDLRTRAGSGIYAKRFDVAGDWLQSDKRVLVCFGAVFHITRAWVNDLPVGAHEGGFLPFRFDITDQLRIGTNVLSVRVDHPTDDPDDYPDTPLAEIPFGKQSWYGPLSGIWQEVWLEQRVREHISRVRIAPDLISGRVRMDVFFAAPLRHKCDLEVTIKAPSGQTAATLVQPAGAARVDYAVELVVPDVKPWSPSSPNLYRASLRLRRSSAPIDAVEETFGFRSIETRNGRFYLNGELLFLRGALDQDYYPDTICTVPSAEFLEDQFRKAKELGLNCVRCHIKAADPRYYEAADRLGLLVWTELPNGGLSTERSRARKEATLKGIVDRDFNHPSIICWTIVNENWGLDLVHDPDHRAWLKNTYHWLKTYDATRLVVDNSPLSPSFHIETDIADYHFYAAYPDGRHQWDAFVDGLASRAPWLFSPEGDAVIKGDEPLVCSEFGNWGLPKPNDLKDCLGREPWWFETGHDWGEGIMYAHGVENRFADWSLDRVFGSLERFVEAAQWQQFRALKYEIETLRRLPEIAGYVITELTDCHWESNGLLDMRRNPRVFHAAFPSINSDTLIIPRSERAVYWSSEEARFDLSIAHGAGPPIEDAVLTISGKTTTSVELPAIQPGSVLHLGKISVLLVQESSPAVQRVQFTLRAANDEVLSSNHVDLAVHPQRLAAPDVRVWSPEAHIRSHMAAMGYALAAGAEDSQVVVAASYGKEIGDYVRGGGRLIYLPEAEGTLNPFFPHWQNVKVQSRESTLWRGDWASSFAWLRRGRAFGHIPGGPLLDDTFERIFPSHVISGCNLHDFQGRVYAGLVVGWIHKPVALLVERTYGRGSLIASTFRLWRDEPGADPTATAMLDGLVRLALGEPRYPVAPDAEQSQRELGGLGELIASLADSQG
jgi:hypothetical protein